RVLPLTFVKDSRTSFSLGTAALSAPTIHHSRAPKKKVHTQRRNDVRPHSHPPHSKAHPRSICTAPLAPTHQDNHAIRAADLVSSVSAAFIFPTSVEIF